MWVDGAFTELDRRERDVEAPDQRSWSDQIYKLRLLQQLIYNDDAQNIRNVIYDPSFRVYAIDTSRSFRSFSSLADERGLRRFSRSLVSRLEALERRADGYSAARHACCCPNRRVRDDTPAPLFR